LGVDPLYSNDFVEIVHYQGTENNDITMAERAGDKVQS
jgi:hypothetical protein